MSMQSILFALALQVCLMAFPASGQGPVTGAPANSLSASEQRDGWKLLFDGRDTKGWRSFKKASFPSQGWSIADGWLHCLGKGGGDIITDSQFTDFEFQWEWRIAPGANSGVKYFVTETRNAAIGHEYQLIDNDQHPDAKIAEGRHLTAGVYDVLKPEGAPPRPPGEINHSRIVVRGNSVEHWLNGSRVLAYECGSAPLKSAVARSKFKSTAGFGEKSKGHLLLQEHGSEVWFRNLKLRELAAP